MEVNEQLGQTEQPEEVVNEQNEQNEQPGVKGDVDERGVPWQNVAKEAQRKVDELNERIAQIESRISTPHIQPMAQPETPQPVQRKRTWDEIVNDSPDDFFDREYKRRRELERREEEQRKYNEAMKEADSLIHKINPMKYKENVSRVSDVIRTRSISMTNPVNAVRSALEWIELEDKANLSARERENVQKQTNEKQRVENIKQKQTTSGTKPPPQKIKPANTAYERAIETGNPRDAEQFFRSSYFNSDK